MNKRDAKIEALIIAHHALTDEAMGVGEPVRSAIFDLLFVFEDRLIRYAETSEIAREFVTNLAEFLSDGS